MERDTSRRRLLLYSSLLTIGTAGCLDGQSGTEAEHGDDHGDNHSHDHSNEHELGSPASEIEVAMRTDDEGSHFVPHVVHVETGGTVKWVVETGTHDTTAYHPETHGNQQRIPDDAEPWESGSMSDEGETFERTFEREGVYDYVCTPHEGVGMIGTVVVGWPDPSDQPGLQPPSDDSPDAAVAQLERYNEQVRGVLEEGSSDGNDGDENDDGHHNETADNHDDHDH